MADSGISIEMTGNALHFPNRNDDSRNSVSENEVRESSFSISIRVSFDSTFHKATLLSCFFNLTNTIIGSGILGLPYAYSHTGWIFGSFMLVICGLSSAFALHTLALCALKQSGPVSLYTLASTSMPMFTVVIDVTVALMCFGIATSHLIVIGDLMPQVMQQFGSHQRGQDRHVWVFLGFCLTAPLSFFRNLDSLKFTSILSIIFVIFLMFLIILYSAGIDTLDACADAGDDSCAGTTTAGVVDVKTGQVLSIFIFGFNCQHNVFAVTNEIHRPTPERINTVIVMSVGISFVIYILVAACGYGTYGSNVDPDILVNYPRTTLTSIARMFVCFLVAFSFPLECHPCRRSVLTLVSLYYDKNEFGVIKEPGERVQFIRYIAVTTAILGCSFIIGLTVSNLGVVLALIGATGATTLSFILPGFFYYIIFKNEGPVWKRNLALAQGIAGLIIMPMCLIFIFL